MTPVNPFPVRREAWKLALVLGAYLAGTALGLWALPPGLRQRFLGASGLATNAFAALLMLGRARALPTERRVWMGLLLGTLLAALANLALAAARWDPLGPLTPAVGLYFAFILASGLAWAASLLAFPWGATGPRSQDLLGSLVFGGSLVLLLWMAGLWEAGFQPRWMAQAVLLALAFRFSLVGGVVTYILADEPRRARGPLGWMLAGALLNGASLLIAWPLVLNPDAQVAPHHALLGVLPLCMALAAWSGSPLTGSLREDGLRPQALDLLMGLPYAGAAAALWSRAHQEDSPLRWPLAWFMAVSSLLVVRQVLLLREVRLINRDLEGRVRSRTRALEEAQALALRTERMNTVALLGAGLAHDLNNALTVILNAIDMARILHAEGSPVTETDLERIAVAATQSAALGGRLMGYARQEMDAPHPLDLGAEVGACEDLMRMLLPPGIRLELRLPSDPVPVMGSREGLEQILLNLVGNAKDALAGSGTIRVTVLARASEGLLEVEDTGPGMSEEIRARLFQPLFTTKAPGRGTGLGLASTRARVDAAGGVIAVRTAPGEGTTFSLAFPRLAS